jgi:hypothetical protein
VPADRDHWDRRPARDAHLPADQKGSFPVAALVDADPDKAASLASRFQVPLATRSIDDALRRVPGTGSMAHEAVTSPFRWEPVDGVATSSIE